MWRERDRGQGPVLFPADLSDLDLKGAAGRRYRLHWYTYEGGARHFDAILKKGWQKTPRLWRMLLSLAFQELIWDRDEKAWAIVDAWVKMTKSVAGAKAVPILNACLREMGRRIDSQTVTIENALPKKLVQTWQLSGKKTQDLVRLLDSPRKNFFHPFKGDLLPDTNAKVVEWSGGKCLIPEQGLPPGELLKTHSGLGFFQNLSAAELSHELLKHVRWPMLDYCAAPGGKSWQLARLTQGKAHINMHEQNPERRKLINDNPLLSHNPALKLVLSEDLQSNQYESILIDVPCDNSGVLIRAPEAIRHQWKGGDDFKSIQTELFASAISLLRESGMIFYSTCSLSTAENERRVAEICQKYGLTCRFEKRWWPDKEGRHGAFLACLEM